MLQKIFKVPIGVQIVRFYLLGIIVTSIYGTGTYLPEIYNEWLITIGIILWFSSVSLYIWSMHVIDRMFDPSSSPNKVDKLCTEGPYSLCRHPIYLSYVLVWLSLTILSANVVVFFGGLFLTPLLLYRIKKEEILLTEKFGNKYEEYASNTNQIIPSFYDQ